MTNYEKIMSELTIKGLAEKMEKYIACAKCEAREFCHKTKLRDIECNKVFEMWLEKEVDE